jgi:ribonuclease HII
MILSVTTMRRSTRLTGAISAESKKVPFVAVASRVSTLSIAYEQKHLACVIGVDEAGRGPLAGPVVAAAIAILNPGRLAFPPVHGVNDSKVIEEDERERLFNELISHPNVVHGIAIIDHSEIDRINILQATFRAMESAVLQLSAKLKNLKVASLHVAVDGPHIPPQIKDSYSSSEGIIGGDSKVYSIAAASILAKVTRDRMMRVYDKQWPLYSFAKHKGYGAEVWGMRRVF